MPKEPYESNIIALRPSIEKKQLELDEQYLDTLFEPVYHALGEILAPNLLTGANLTSEEFAKSQPQEIDKFFSQLRITYSSFQALEHSNSQKLIDYWNGKIQETVDMCDPVNDTDSPNHLRAKIEQFMVEADGTENSEIHDVESNQTPESVEKSPDQLLTDNIRAILIRRDTDQLPPLDSKILFAVRGYFEEIQASTDIIGTEGAVMDAVLLINTVIEDLQNSSADPQFSTNIDFPTADSIMTTVHEAYNGYRERQTKNSPDL